MGNLDLYEKYAEVPQSAQKSIQAGRLKGMTDINPMWRIKALTEAFGSCGKGWKTKIIERWIDAYGDEAVCNIVLALYYRTSEKEEWSDEVIGIGGAKISTVERNGVYISDEAWKCAYTDAISVACKALGIGANVYWANGRSKYTAAVESPAKEPTKAKVEVKVPSDITEMISYVVDAQSANAAVKSILSLGLDSEVKKLVSQMLSKKATSEGLIYDTAKKLYVAKEETNGN